MSKKIVIIISILLVIIGLIVLLSFTLFSLKSVTIDYRTSHVNIALSNDEIVEKADFKMGASVFFHGKKDYINNIEEADPYIKVINIETVFPSSFTIHLAERQEIYAIEYQNEYLVCDDELKILKKTNDFTSTQNNSILLKGLDIQNKNLQVGDFLSINNDNFVDMYSVLYEFNYPLGQQQSLIEQIEFKKIFDDNLNKYLPACEITMFNGQVYILNNCTYGVKAKTKLMLDVFSQIFSYIGKTIELENNEKIILEEKHLENCIIEINNYYDYSKYSEDDCYFKLIPNLQ